MAGGFTSPAPWLGISASPVTVTGGYITLPWFQGGGTAAVEQGGYITLPWFQAGGGVAGEEGGGFGSGSPQGSERRFRIGLSQEPIKFVSVSQQFDVEVPGTLEAIDQTSAGIQDEIDRHILALQLLDERLSLIQTSALMKMAEVELDAMLARQFRAELELKIMQLRRIKKRRSDEEVLVIILATSG